MKKLLVTFSILLLCLTAGAQSIKVRSGSLAVLNGENVVATSFTYENMKVGKMAENDYVNKKVSEYNKKRSGYGETWHENWINDRSSRYEPKFNELFGKYLGEKGINLDGDANYMFVINADFIEPGFNVGVTRKNASVNLTCHLINKSDGTEVAVITIINASANNFWGDDYDVGYRVQESFAKAGRELAKFIIKECRL
ncbi:MAG: hypothetical protein PHT25_08630 [Bacteroidales bacterium]|nr:hypothetical protein [Bacteroidales bacterium]